MSACLWLPLHPKSRLFPSRHHDNVVMAAPCPHLKRGYQATPQCGMPPPEEKWHCDLCALTNGSMFDGFIHTCCTMLCQLTSVACINSGQIYDIYPAVFASPYRVFAATSYFNDWSKVTDTMSATSSDGHPARPHNFSA